MMVQFGDIYKTSIVLKDILKVFKSNYNFCINLDGLSDVDHYSSLD